jgi:glutamine synthetase adenylyltransferase
LSALRRAARAALLAGILAGHPALAQGLLDEDTTRLLVEAVEAAAELDLYNTRCRTDQSGRRTENLNKVLAARFRITVIGVQDRYFPEHSYRKAQERVQNAFLERLKAAGGCAEARAGGLRDALEDRHRETLGAIEALP